MKQSPKEVADRIWLIRDQVKKNQANREKDAQFKDNLDYQLNLYIEEYGLPSGYLSKEELLHDLALMESVPCGTLIEKE